MNTVFQFKSYKVVSLFKLFSIIIFLSYYSRINAQVTLGGVDLGKLTEYHMVFTDGSGKAKWQGASKGFVGNFAVDGLQANEETSGSVPFKGSITTNDSSLNGWQDIYVNNSSQAEVLLNKGDIISGLEADLQNVFNQINSLSVTAAYNSISPADIQNLNVQDGQPQTYVINFTSGFSVSEQINITGDSGDIFIFRWDTDADFTNGYDGQVKFQSGGAFVPLGDLKPTNFLHVAGDINASGGGETPALPYPQGPRLNDGSGDLITGAKDFSGGGFFTGYWFTKGKPGEEKTSDLSNAIFVGGWYSTTNQFTMTSGTSGIYVSPPVLSACLGDKVFFDSNTNGIQDSNELGAENISVELLDVDKTVKETVMTDENGNYKFTITEPGDYLVKFNYPEGYMGTLQNVNSDIEIDSDPDPSTGITNRISVQNGDVINTIDAGLIKRSSISQQLLNEKQEGVPSIDVVLVDSDKNELLQQTTDNVGTYKFDYLLPNIYSVKLANIEDFTKVTGFDESGFSTPITLSEGESKVLQAETIVLPVKLISFDAKLDNNKVVLTWSSTDEVVFKNYEVQKIDDNLNWVTIGFVSPQNTSEFVKNYSFTDRLVAGDTRDTHSYRLKLNDLDGLFEYSIVISVHNDIYNKLNIYPTITTDILNVSYNTNKVYEIQVISYNGEIVESMKTSDSNTVIYTNDYQEGIYYIRVIDQNKVLHLKWIKI